MANDLSAALRCLSLSSEDDSITISYLQNLSRSENDYFPIKWGGVAVKTVTIKGIFWNSSQRQKQAKLRNPHGSTYHLKSSKFR